MFSSSSYVRVVRTKFREKSMCITAVDLQALGKLASLVPWDSVTFCEQKGVPTSGPKQNSKFLWGAVKFPRKVNLCHSYQSGCLGGGSFLCFSVRPAHVFWQKHCTTWAWPGENGLGGRFRFCLEVTLDILVLCVFWGLQSKSTLQQIQHQNPQEGQQLRVLVLLGTRQNGPLAERPPKVPDRIPEGMCSIASLYVCPLYITIPHPTDRRGPWKISLSFSLSFCLSLFLSLSLSLSLPLSLSPLSLSLSHSLSSHYVMNTTSTQQRSSFLLQHLQNNSGIAFSILSMGAQCQKARQILGGNVFLGKHGSSVDIFVR